MSNAKFNKKQFMVLGTEIYIKQHLLIIKHEKREKLLIHRNPIASEKKHFFQVGTLQLK